MRIAFITTVLLTLVGLLFKIQHWPGAGIICVLGFFTLFVLMIVSGIKSLGSKVKRPLNGAERLVAAWLLLALLFKIQHWPGGGILLVVTLTTLALKYFAGLWALLNSGQAEESRPSPASFALGFCYSVLIIGILFKTQQWPGGDLQVMVGLFSAIPVHVWHWFSVKGAEPSYTWHADTVLRGIWLLGWGALILI